MACGCGGSKKPAQNRAQVERQQKRAADARRPRAPISMGDPGFAWTGPARSPSKPR